MEQISKQCFVKRATEWSVNGESNYPPKERCCFLSKKTAPPKQKSLRLHAPSAPVSGDPHDKVDYNSRRAARLALLWAPRVAATERLGGSSMENGRPPDPADWAVMDVVDYFRTAGFEEQASVFQEQEIDGKSLLLMTRNDVLTGLQLKLGPALKIYEYHVKPLQTKHLKNSSS
nr:sterile alpha motif domain-containing protein 13 [Meriones unguiculatus]